MGKVKFLQLADVIKAFEIIDSQVVPAGGAAVLYRLKYSIGLDDLFADLRIEALKNTFIDCRKRVAFQQQADFNLVEAVGKPQFLLNMAANFD